MHKDPRLILQLLLMLSIHLKTIKVLINFIQ